MSATSFRDPSGKREVKQYVRERRHGGPTPRVGGTEPWAECR
jgi:hypothetical protein